MVGWLLWSKGKSFPLVLQGRKICWRCHRDLSHCLPLPPFLPPPPLFLFPGQEVGFMMSSCFLKTQSSWSWGRPSPWTAQRWWSSTLEWTFDGLTLANRYIAATVGHTFNGISKLNTWISFNLTSRTVGRTLSPTGKPCLTPQRLSASWPSTVSMSRTLARTAATSPAWTQHKPNKLRS